MSRARHYNGPTVQSNRENAVRRNTISIYLLAAGLALASCGLTVAEDGTAKPISFVREVAPILVGKCQGCHGPRKAESNFRLDTFELLMKTGDLGTPPITPGDLAESQLYQLITAEDPDERMPMNGSRLADAETAMIAAWIRQGANFDGKSRAVPLREQIPSDIAHRAAPAIYPAAVPITAMTFAPDGSRLIVAGYHELLVWDPTSGALVARVTNIPQRTFAVAFAPDGSWLAVAGGQPGVSGEVRLIPWNGAEEQAPMPKVLATSDDVFFDVAWRPDGNQIAACGADGSFRVFDIPELKQRAKINNHADWVTGLCYSPDGKQIATASRDKTVKVFDAEGSRLLATYTEHKAPVRAVAFSPEGQKVVSAGGNRIHLWNVDDGKLVGELSGFTSDVSALAICGEDVLGGSADRWVRQFKLSDRTFLRALSAPAGIVSLACHAAAHRVGVGCVDGTVTVWDSRTGELIKQFLAVPIATETKK
jgi:hypothetical protein